MFPCVSNSDISCSSLRIRFRYFLCFLAPQSSGSCNWFVLAELHQSPVDLLSNVSCSEVAHQSPDSSNWFVLAELHQSPIDLLPDFFRAQ